MTFLQILFWLIVVFAVGGLFVSSEKYPWIGIPRYVTLLALIICIGLRVFKMSVT